MLQLANRPEGRRLVDPPKLMSPFQSGRNYRVLFPSLALRSYQRVDIARSSALEPDLVRSVAETDDAASQISSLRRLRLI
jgi:hypothetical protein